MKFELKIGLLAITVCLVLADSVQARADGAGDKLMKEVAAKYKSLRTLTGTITIQDHMGKDVLQDKETVVLARPNLARFVAGSLVFNENGIPHPMTPHDSLVIYRGTHTWCYSQDRNTYTQQKIKADLFDPDPTSFLVTLFYTPDTFLSTNDLIGTELVREKAEASLENRITGTRNFEGNTCRVLEQTLTIRPRPPDKPTVHKTVFIIDANLLVHRIFRTMIQPKRNHQDSQTEIITALHVDMPIPATDFTFVPPARAKLIKQ